MAFNDNWPDGLDMLDLMDAWDARREEVILGGRKFTIRYENDECFVQAIDDYVPCGWFSADSFKEFR